MNAKETKTVRQEALRFMKDVKLTEGTDKYAIKIELPYTNSDGKPLYFFVTKRKDSKKFSLLLPVESSGLVALSDTLKLLQPMLRTYGLLLSQEAVIMEESNLSLHHRIRNFAQALIGIDGVRRLWKVEHDRRLHVFESEAVEPVGHAADN